MSSKKELERAMRRAETRDKKHRTKMKVGGKNVFALKRIMDGKKIT